MIIKFVNYSKDYCELSWRWLNDVEIKQLTMTPDFTKETQNEWFNSLISRKDYLIWGVECDYKPIGVVGLKRIDYILNSAEYFGYIGEKEYWSRGIGSFMMEFIIKSANENNLLNLYLKVLKTNIRAINLYLKSEFKIYQDNGEYVNMIRKEMQKIV